MASNAGQFAKDLKAFVARIEQRQQEIFIRCTLEVKRSVVEGSDITGAPGQPIDTGNLVGSFIPEFTGPHSWQITTGVDYAPYVEENARDVVFHNHGPHSVAMTRNGWPRIVEAAIEQTVEQ